MRIVQRIILYVLALAAIAGGIALVIAPVPELYQQVIPYIPSYHGVGRIAVGCAVAALCIFAILPLGRRRRKISFEGPHGNIAIELESVENTLRKNISKLPSVRKAALQLVPDKKSRTVRVKADVHLIKPGGGSTCDATTQLNEEIARHARQLLGPDEVSGVDLGVKGITEDSKGYIAPTPMPSSGRATTDRSRVPIEEEHPVETLPQFMETPKPEPELVSGRPVHEPPLQLAENEEEPEPEMEHEHEEHADTSYSTLLSGESHKDTDDDKHQG